MSFGPHRFTANVKFAPLMGRWISLLVIPLLLVILPMLIGGAPTSSVSFLFLMAVSVVAIYVGVALLGLGYWAAFLREAIGNTRLGSLEFSFDARSRDWLMLFLGNAALVVFTLGLGLVFIDYRNWAFYVRHLEASGSVELDMLTQSTETGDTDAEGLAAAFDIGAI